MLYVLSYGVYVAFVMHFSLCFLFKKRNRKKTSNAHHKSIVLVRLSTAGLEHACLNKEAIADWAAASFAPISFGIDELVECQDPRCSLSSTACGVNAPSLVYIYAYAYIYIYL